jgi:hypothetical protein
MWIGGSGWVRFVDERKRLSGGVMLAFALILILVATLSGGFDCLPWHWGRCGQQQTEYHQTFQHDAGNVSQKPLAVAWEPVRASLICLSGSPQLVDGSHIAESSRIGGGL